jgi:pimeloyl-ACP methyl ester carboxylesterase
VTRAAPRPLRVEVLRARTDDDWLLELRRAYAPGAFDPRRPPLLLVPGYGMNGFIFGYHPGGVSMRQALCDAGHEVWTVHLRGQEGTRALSPRAPPATLARYALHDLPAAVEVVREASHTDDHRVVLVGCSLGGSLSYAYLAHTPEAPVGGLVTMGSPLRWDDVHPVVRLAFSSPRLASLVRVRGTRRLAGAVLPAAARVPFALAPYLNAAHVDLTHAPAMVRTIEDPEPGVNRDLARWMAARDLVVRGKNVREALRQVRAPLLVVVANADGIVPERAAVAALPAWGGARADVLRVGDARRRWAHADLFVAAGADRHVFAPIAAWLADAVSHRPR